jgi:hypothetical protein
MTYKQAMYAILISSAAVVGAGCQQDAAAPAPAAQTGGGEEDKVRVQLNLGERGSIDYEKKDKASK